MSKTITGTWQFPDGSAVANGTLYLQLSQDAVITGSQQVAPRIVQITLGPTGAIPASTVIFGNDELSPSGSLYQVTVTQSGGGRIYGPELYSITGGSPINLNNFTPLTSGVFVSVGPKFQQFTTSGTFTIPIGITLMKVTVLGGGGAGGGSNGANCGVGGGAGGMSIAWLSGLVPGNTLTVTIGAGGNGASAATGGNGTPSSLSSGTQVISSITANGGVGGAANTTISSGPVGGTATGGNINVSGGPGSTAWAGTVSSNGANSFYGAGGNAIAGSAGLNASGFGAGGGGAQGAGPFAGGNGSPGIIVFEWVG